MFDINKKRQMFSAKLARFVVNIKNFRLFPCCKYLLIIYDLPGVFGEQGNSVNLAMGTREQSKKNIGNKGTRNIMGNRGTNPFFRKNT